MVFSINDPFNSYVYSNNIDFDFLEMGVLGWNLVDNDGDNSNVYNRDRINYYWTNDSNWRNEFVVREKED